MSWSTPPPRELWTVDDLPEEGRFEIVDGVLQVSPQPSLPHETVVSTLHYLLAHELGPRRVFTGAGMAFTRTNYRVPDVSVLREGLDNRSTQDLTPSDFVLAVEVVSPSSVATDHVTKRAQYAAAGVPSYWIVELDPELRLTALSLRGGVYVESGSWGEGERATLSEPTAISIDIASLLG